MTLESLNIPFIPDEKIIIISDTHLGSIYENKQYLYDVYEYAKKHGITTILHLGDLIQSTMRNVNNKYRNEYNQICHVIEDYPKDPYITNQILLGNHDYHTLRKNEEYMKMLKTREDFNILGFGKYYINWQGYYIGLIHQTPKYKIKIPHLKTLMNLYGHSHKLMIQNPHHILAPTLSDDLKEDSIPGFLVATMKNDIMLLENIEFTPTITKSKLILTKKS